MIAGNVWDFGGVVIAAAITAIGLYLAARAGARHGGRQGAESAKTEVLDAIDTTNGKSLGATVHDMAGTLEVVETRQHQMLAVQTEHSLLLSKAENDNAQIHEVANDARTMLLAHLEEIEPLKHFVEHLMDERPEDP